LDHPCRCFGSDRAQPIALELDCSAFVAGCFFNEAKKKIGTNIPPDGRWLFRFDTQGPVEKLRRILAAKKFNATLGGKLDAQISKVADLLDSQLTKKETDRVRSEYTEHPIDPKNIGTPAEALGGPISYSSAHRRDAKKTARGDDPSADAT
jgi:hypothetical protein